MHASEHGTGYPSMVNPRECLLASRPVHVVDIYDALCSRCPCGDALMIRQARINRMSVERAPSEVPAETLASVR